jgi:hypothetical protein
VSDAADDLGGGAFGGPGGLFPFSHLTYGDDGDWHRGKADLTGCSRLLIDQGYNRRTFPSRV